MSLGIDESVALEEIERLGARSGNVVSQQGDLCVIDGQTTLSKAVASAASDEASMLYRGVMPPTQTLQVLHMEFLKGLSALVTSSRRQAAGVA